MISYEGKEYILRKELLQIVTISYEKMQHNLRFLTKILVKNIKMTIYIIRKIESLFIIVITQFLRDLFGTGRPTMPSLRASPCKCV